MSKNFIELHNSANTNSVYRLNDNEEWHLRFSIYYRFLDFLTGTLEFVKNDKVDLESFSSIIRLSELETLCQHFGIYIDVSEREKISLIKRFFSDNKDKFDKLLHKTNSHLED